MKKSLLIILLLLSGQGVADEFIPSTTTITEAAHPNSYNCETIELTEAQAEKFQKLTHEAEKQCKLELHDLNENHRFLKYVIRIINKVKNSLGNNSCGDITTEIETLCPNTYTVRN
ncbi:hypothetical protein CTM88_20690 [Photobacterium aquimaris]|uniref:DUF5339 domain-containing protein n=1 Tax=Photobacterium aquimaris TaxID=512643 RepID=A0A2T3IEH1_9GAMM|nr:hypothetical protein [Photobacterium aquimaris]OBU19975.1 hypothetical protein AYY20_16720 [Photobacterium aquimaris]PSU21754.1 hypothetical protein CTM88_20690 [Photobacterium aquimaris]